MAEETTLHYTWEIKFNQLCYILIFIYIIYPISWCISSYTDDKICVWVVSGTIDVNIVVTYRSYTSWKIHPHRYRIIGHNEHQLPILVR